MEIGVGTSYACIEKDASRVEAYSMLCEMP